ncbi:MAG: endo-1,4-beta-xylanase [Alphaproteobacteria bacterium]|nr:endo-1,4-beta-xylanase [Alphaproteobacteria bacterium]
MSEISRRECVTAALAAAVGCVPLQNAMAKNEQAAGTGAESLNGVAQTKGLHFGSCIGTGSTKGELALLPPAVLARPRRPVPFDDARMRALMVEQCGILVPENELKWYVVRPESNKFDFRRADILVDFATRHRMAVRGHNLFWNATRWMPRWQDNYDFGSRPATAAERMLRDHIFKVCRRYGKRIFSYDVINETINQQTGELNDTVFTKHLGWNLVDICFHAAREAAPHAELVYNDFPSWGPNGTHRSGILKLLDYVKKRNLPVDALGVQGHIGYGTTGGGPGSERDEPAWRKFLDDVTSMGFDLLITEFDINDKSAPTDIAVRDRAVADVGKAYFDIMVSYPQLRYVMVWGLVDKYNWLQEFIPRADGLPQRPCPYDDNYNPKPLRDAMAEAFRSAPARPAMNIKPA